MREGWTYKKLGEVGNVVTGSTPSTKDAANYAEMKEKFTAQYFEALPAEARATQCMDCEECLPKCPQQIRIPNQLSRIVELLRK